MWRPVPGHAGIAVMVRRTDSGEPIPGAYVTVAELRREPELQTGRADSGGFVYIGPLGAAAHLITVRMIGHIAYRDTVHVVADSNLIGEVRLPWDPNIRLTDECGFTVSP